MAAEKPIYDLTLLLDSKIEDNQRTKIVNDIEAIILKKGEIVDRRDWGLRPTTFRLDKEIEAYYRLIQFQGPNDLLEQLDHVLKITDGILRFRVIKIKAGSPPAPELKREYAPIADEESTSSKNFR